MLVSISLVYKSIKRERNMKEGGIGYHVFHKLGKKCEKREKNVSVDIT